MFIKNIVSHIGLGSESHIGLSNDSHQENCATLGLHHAQQRPTYYQD